MTLKRMTLKRMTSEGITMQHHRGSAPLLLALAASLTAAGCHGRIQTGRRAPARHFRPRPSRRPAAGPDESSAQRGRAGAYPGIPQLGRIPGRQGGGYEYPATEFRTRHGVAVRPPLLPGQPSPTTRRAGLTARQGCRRSSSRLTTRWSGSSARPRRAGSARTARSASWKTCTCPPPGLAAPGHVLRPDRRGP